MRIIANDSIFHPTRAKRRKGQISWWNRSAGAVAASNIQSFFSAMRWMSPGNLRERCWWKIFSVSLSEKLLIILWEAGEIRHFLCYNAHKKTPPVISTRNFIKKKTIAKKSAASIAQPILRSLRYCKNNQKRIPKRIVRKTKSKSGRSGYQIKWAKIIGVYIS